MGSESGFGIPLLVRLAMWLLRTALRQRQGVCHRHMGDVSVTYLIYVRVPRKIAAGWHRELLHQAANEFFEEAQEPEVQA